MFSSRRLVLVLLIAVVAQGCSSSLYSPLSRRSEYPREEIDVGERLHQEIASAFSFFPEPELQAYVSSVGQRLASQNNLKLSYRFFIIDHEKIYATAAPGGFVYITTGMLRFLQSEAELACILAYEMASLQYPYPQLSRVKKILEHLTQAGMMVGSAFGEIGALTAIGLLTLQVALKAQELTPQKKTQLVDQDALAMVANAGYNPQSYLHLLYTMQQISPPLKPYLYDYSQSHPLTDARIRLVAEKVQQFPKEIFFASAHEELYQKMTRSLGSAYSR